jgi:flagellin
MPRAQKFKAVADVTSHLRGILVAAAALLGAGVLAPSEAQAQLDESARAIRSAEDEPQDRPRFQVLDVSPDVIEARVRNARLINGEQHVNIRVFASAQAAAIYLSAGCTALNLGNSNGSFTLQIEGELGLRQLTFSSGTTMSNIAAAIDSYREITGVTAMASATGVQLRSLGSGAHKFVSVAALCHPLLGTATGFYQMQPLNLYEADPSSWTPILGYVWVMDRGQDVRAEVNGMSVDSRGPVVRVHRPWLTADIRLREGPAIGPANAQTLGSFHAFTIIRSP